MPQFGTSGLRGLATDLTDDLCATYAAAFVSLHEHNGRLFIGQDKRESSPRIAAAVAEGAASQGVDIVDCGVLPTPALAGAALKEKTLSIMVTGSHIPADRNGLKFYTGTGEFTKADEAPLAEAVATWKVERKTPTTHPSNAIAAYVHRYVSGLPKFALEGRTIGVWLHSSAAENTLPMILSGLGAQVVTFGASERFVPVDTEAVDLKTREQLKMWVLKNGLDALISTDGDADRPLMVDDTGTIVPGDILGPITAKWCGATDVVTTVSANTMVDQMGAFSDVARTRIGSPYVIAEMEARMASGNGKVAGYEPNGGFLLGWDVSGRISLPRLMTRDSTLPLVAPIAAAVERGLTLSSLLAELPARSTATDRLQDVPRDVSDKIVAQILDGDTSFLPDELGQLDHIDQTDGVRMTFKSGRIVHIRPSGNAPELRCYVEAENKNAAESVLMSTFSTLASLVAAQNS